MEDVLMSEKSKKIAEKLKKKRESKPKDYWLDMPEEEGLEDADFVPVPTPHGMLRKGIKKGVSKAVQYGSKEAAKRAASKAAVKAAAKSAKDNKKPAHGLEKSTIKDPPPLDKGYGKSIYEKMPKWKAKMQQKKSGY
jgi:hypothetical protein